jgi:hypothetical protein
MGRWGDGVTGRKGDRERGRESGTAKSVDVRTGIITKSAYQKLTEKSGKDLTSSWHISRATRNCAFMRQL